MEWMIEHWEEVCMIASGLVSVASVITKLTPSPKDDEILKKVLAWLSFLQPRGVSGMKMPLTPSMVPCDKCPDPSKCDC